ncbi:MAG: hypothetical protein M1835_007314 [Candelina submexicana]|nr:MAG: hypothetical protein M1835_007314 [Candelina submexicana]
MAQLTTQAGSDKHLSPLPEVLFHGLIAVSATAWLSLLFTLALCGFLTHRLVVFARQYGVFCPQNQFVVLIYNLVLADIQQSVAFAVNTHWLYKNAIDAPSIACFIQGWFMSTGDLASGVFILAIAVHTFWTVVYNYRMRGLHFGLFILACWLIIIAMAVIGVALHQDDLYTRAGAWCWISSNYDKERLYLHYLWIFMIEFSTIIIYAVLFVILRRRVKPIPGAHLANKSMSSRAEKAAYYMVIYPMAYVLLTLPLAAGRMSSMTGREPTLGYYCFAGGMIASCGWVDVVLYAYTRRMLLFHTKPEITPPTSNFSRSATTIAASQVSNSAVSLGSESAVSIGESENSMEMIDFLATSNMPDGKPAETTAFSGPGGLYRSKLCTIKTPKYVYGFKFTRTPVQKDFSNV